ncbi:MAG: hypothetical protein SOZ89_03445 [Peptoniphilaceae bacterium]|nr:hypothetical protein [Peptoniphilaceae bacterium]MDD7382881.1 hypothetical protein [Peptoniphilaceae bacterium]MDY3738160.1 hypothetical protein [Peptoniphilaceae bacterium]
MDKIKRYIITIIAWILIFPITGIVGLSFLLSGVVVMVVGVINFILMHFDIDFGLVNIFNYNFGNFTEFIISLGIGITLFIIGNKLWRITKQIYNWLQSLKLNPNFTKR